MFNDSVVHVLSLWKLVGLWHRLLTRLLVTGYTCIYSNFSNPSRISDSHSFWCSYCPFNWAWSSWVACFYESARCCPSSCPLSLCNLIIEFLIVVIGIISWNIPWTPWKNRAILSMALKRAILLIFILYNYMNCIVYFCYLFMYAFNLIELVNK